MTEYDFSPEAHERALATQNRIARWVDDTNRHPPANPFVPIPGEHGSVSAPTSPPPTIPNRTPPPQLPAQLPQQYYIYQPQQPTLTNPAYPAPYSPPQGVVSPTYVSVHKRHKSKRSHSKSGSRSLNHSPNKPPSIALPTATIPIGNGMYATAVQTQLAQPMPQGTQMMVRSPVIRSTSAPPSVVTSPYYFYYPQSPPTRQQQPLPGYAGLQQMQAQSLAYAQVHPSVGYTSPLNSPPIQPVIYSPRSNPRSIKSQSRKSSISIPTPTVMSPVSPPAAAISYVQPVAGGSGVGGGFVFVGNAPAPAPNYIYGPPQPRSHGHSGSPKETQSFFGALTKKSSKRTSPTIR